jgi:predicted secreted hydrolase
MLSRRVVVGIVVVILIAGVAFVGLPQLRGQRAPQYSADVVTALSGGNNEGFARAYDVRAWSFPADHAAHPEFQTEWWYNTGNLRTADGRHFGFHFTIFRRALTPDMPARESEWATNQVYFADLAIADVQAGRFIYRERFARGAAGLAGAVADPLSGVRIWIEDWSVTGTAPEASALHLRAAEGPIGLDLIARKTRPPTLQGDRGLSIKSAEPGNASYYYSLTRLETVGTITIEGETFEVSGNSWMDHEFSTSVLGADAVGWDWFSLQLDNNRELMLFQIRLADGGLETTSHGTLIESDGSTVHLSLEDYTIEPLGSWTSPHTGAVYPAGWRLTIAAPSGPLNLEVWPLLSDQELNTTTAYWEGASRITGTDNGEPVAGFGYVELTGYNRALR